MRTLPLLLLAACNGTVGTLSVTLTTAPGSTLLDGAQTLNLTITNPHQVTTATRGAHGFTIDLQMPATTATGSIIVEALDASGTRIAAGESPPVPFGAVDATIAIYNAFDHSLTGGLALPAARSGVAVGVGANNQVYLFGGSDDAGTPTGTAWRFDTNAAPNGAYTDFGDKAGFARADAALVPLGNDHFLITGNPAAELNGLGGTVAAHTEIASLPAAGASLVGTDGIVTSVFAGDTGIVRYRNATFDTLDTTPRTGAAVVALPTGKLAVVCGPSPVLVDPATGALTPLTITAPAGCGAAATARHLVIAADATAQVFDATTLAPIAQPALVAPRTSPNLIALPNGQVLIAGGTDTSGKPIATLELFTPEPQ